MSQKRWLIFSVAVFCTVAYLYYFRFFLAISLVFAMAIGDYQNIPLFLSGTAMDLYMLTASFAPPLAIPVSLYFMWSRYFRKQYGKALLFAWIPVCVVVIDFLVYSGIFFMLDIMNGRR